MEIIDKRTPGFERANARQGVPTLSMRTGNWIISKAACEKFGISSGQNIHFLVEIDRLYFYWDDDALDGIGMCKGSPKGDGIRFRGIRLYNILRPKFPLHIKEGARFNLRESNTKFNEKKLIEVLIHKRL